MAPKEAIQRLSLIDFAAARDEGLAHLNETATDYKMRIDLPEDEIKDYLTKNIVFRVDDQMQKGLTRYFELAHKHGLIPQLKTPEHL